MRNQSSPIAMVVSLFSILSIGLVMLACGSSNSSPKNLTPAQAQSIATAVSNGMAQAMGGAFGVSLVRPGGNPVENVEPSSTPTPPICLLTPAGEVCTWTISSTYACAGGGNIQISGTIGGTLSSSGAGSAQAQIAANPANCSVNGIVLNGNPQVNLAAQLNILNDSPVWPVTGTETGGVTYGPNPSGSCQLNLSFSVNSNSSCTVTGTACGQTVSGSC